MPLILPGNVASAVSGAYEVANSCRFNNDASAYKTFGTPTSARKLTLSAWVKRSDILTDSTIFSVYTNTSNRTDIRFNPDEKLNLYENVGDAEKYRLVTAREFKDPNAWYHIVLAMDTEQGTTANRIKIYVNGVQETAFDTEVYPDEDYDLFFGSALAHSIGSNSNDEYYFAGYMAEVYYIDGTQYAASDFGEFDEDSPNIWKPKDASGLTFGNNGFYLDFEASDNLGNDANGGTDLTEAGLAAVDQCVDSPTNNFGTWNALDPFSGTAATYAQGNNYVSNGGGGADWSTSNIGLTTGKWYMEMLIVQMSSVRYTMATVVANHSPGTNGDAQAQPYSWTYYGHNGHKYNLGDVGEYGDTWTVGDYISIALDLDNLKVYFAKNGVWQDSGDPTSGATGTGAAHTVAAPADTHLGAYFFGLSDHGSGSSQASFNFGNGSFGETAAGATNADDNGYGIFKYDVPAGYLAVCTKNLGSDGG